MKWVTFSYPVIFFCFFQGILLLHSLLWYSFFMFVLTVFVVAQNDSTSCTSQSFVCILSSFVFFFFLRKKYSLAYFLRMFFFDSLSLSQHLSVFSSSFGVWTFLCLLHSPVSSTNGSSSLPSKTGDGFFFSLTLLLDDIFLQVLDLAFHLLLLLHKSLPSLSHTLLLPFTLIVIRCLLVSLIFSFIIKRKKEMK